MNPRLFHLIGVWLSNNELIKSMMASRVLFDPFEKIFIQRSNNFFNAFENYMYNYLTISSDCKFLCTVTLDSKWMINVFHLLDLSLYSNVLIDGVVTELVATNSGVVYTIVNSNFIQEINYQTCIETTMNIMEAIQWIQYSPKHWIIILTNSGHLIWFNLLNETNKKMFVHKDSMNSIRCFAFSMKKDMIAIVSDSNTVHIIPFDDSKYSRRIQFTASILSVCFADNDRYLFCSSHQKIYIYDLENNLSKYEIECSRAQCMTYCPHQNAIWALVSNALVKITIDIETKELKMIEKNRADIGDFIISPNGQYLLHLSNQENKIYICKLTEDDLEDYFEFVVNNHLNLRDMEFSSDSKFLLVRKFGFGGGKGYDFEMWHLETKTCLYKSN